MTSLSQKELLVYFRFLLVLTVLSTSPYAPAFGNVCNTVQGAPSNSRLPTWSMPIYATGTSATLNVKASTDFFINLHQNNTQNPPPYTGYQFLVGGWANSGSQIRTIQTPTGVGAATILTGYNGILLSASAYRAFWISWTNGSMAIGTGSVVGLNGFMDYTAPSPQPINYILIGSISNGSTFFLTYCFNQRYVDQSVPVNAPDKMFSESTSLECGRACADDPNCEGYAMNRGDVIVTGCNIYYSIPSLTFDADHVTYLVRTA